MPNEHRTLWYAKPAEHWASEALPIGNGRMGAMLFGGVNAERIQFNENSLWSGNNNWDGDYECGDHGFGAYRNFGDLYVEFGTPDNVHVTSPSGHEKGDGNSIDNSVDGQKDTKWCIDQPGQLVVWQVELPEAKAIASYAITSANDVPARDPQQWTLAGSLDGKTWQELDRRNLGKPFASRRQTRRFTVEKPVSSRFYRLSFVPSGASHFQLAWQRMPHHLKSTEPQHSYVYFLLTRLAMTNRRTSNPSSVPLANSHLTEGNLLGCIRFS
jgi:alpha-L-fucosidase 2